MASAAVENDGEGDLLGGGDFNGGHTGGQDFTEFESSFPTLDTRNEVTIMTRGILSQATD